MPKKKRVVSVAKAWALIDPECQVVGDTVSTRYRSVLENAVHHLMARRTWAKEAWGAALAARKNPNARIGWQARRKAEDAVWAAAEARGWTIEHVRLTRISRSVKPRYYEN